MGTIAMPRDLAERIRRYLEEIQDEGPHGEGWKSPELIRDINAVVDLLGLPESKKVTD